MDKANRLPRAADVPALPLRDAFAQILVALVHDINNALGIALGNAHLARDVLQGSNLGDIGSDTVDSIALAASLTRIVSLYGRCLPSANSVFDLRAALDQSIAAHDSKRNQGEHLLVKSSLTESALVEADRLCLDLVLAMLLARATSIDQNTAPTVQLALRRVRRGGREGSLPRVDDVKAIAAPLSGLLRSGSEFEVVVRCSAEALPSAVGADAFESSMATDGMQEGVISLWFARAVARAAGGDFWVTRAPRAATALLHLSLPCLRKMEAAGGH